jgi:hypothetical protein
VSNPTNGKSWSKERLQDVYKDFQADRPEQVSNLINPVVAKPLHQNSIARMLVVLGAAALLALVGWISMNGNSKTTNPVANEPTPTPVEDADGNSEGWKAAATQGTANGLPIEVPVKTPTPTPAATTQPTSVKPTVRPTPIATARPAPAKPQIVYKTVYKTVPAPAKPTPVVNQPKPVPRPVIKVPIAKTPIIAKAPIVAKTPIVAKAPPRSFIPIARNNSSRPTRAPTIRTARKPLASENVLLSGVPDNTRFTKDTLVPGTSVVGHLLSPMQSSSTSNQSSPSATTMKVALDQPLRMMGGRQIPAGSMVIFAATIDPQNGAIAAVSGDAWHSGKTISIPQGSISIQTANKQPLIATSFKPRTGDLARADTNNALLGAVGQVGEELTKSTASVNVGNGSTIIQQTNNPNIVGAVLKGGFQTWSTDQRVRTQAEASQILATQPIQYLAQGTPVTLIVNRPATIALPR